MLTAAKAGFVRGEGLVANEYSFSLTFSQTNTMRTVAVGLQLLTGQYNRQWNQIRPVSVLGCLAVVILFLVSSATCKWSERLCRKDVSRGDTYWEKQVFTHQGAVGPDANLVDPR